MHRYIYTYIYIYHIYICIHTCIHTYKHIHIHTYIDRWNNPPKMGDTHKANTHKMGGTHKANYLTSQCPSIASTVVNHDSADFCELPPVSTLGRLAEILKSQRFRQFTS